jgi:hypothetical protein
VAVGRRKPGEGRSAAPKPLAAAQTRYSRSDKRHVYQQDGERNSILDGHVHFTRGSRFAAQQAPAAEPDAGLCSAPAGEQHSPRRRQSVLLMRKLSALIRQNETPASTNRQNSQLLRVGRRRLLRSAGSSSAAWSCFRSPTSICTWIPTTLLRAELWHPAAEVLAKNWRTQRVAESLAARCKTLSGAGGMRVLPGKRVRPRRSLTVTERSPGADGRQDRSVAVSRRSHDSALASLLIC